MEAISPPWSLKGKGYIMVFKFSFDFIAQHSFLPKEWMKWHKGGFGSVMLVDYHESNAGPYRELLFIPGKFSFFGRKHYTISKIYVSTEASVVSGRANWAIPKELADFDWSNTANCDRINVTHKGIDVLDITLKPKGPAFPVTTSFLSISIGQEDAGRTLITRPSGQGWGRLASLKSVLVNKDNFPDIAGIKPLAICRVDPFQMIFPPAQEIGG